MIVRNAARPCVHSYVRTHAYGIFDQEYKTVSNKVGITIETNEIKQIKEILFMWKYSCFPNLNFYCANNEK